MLKVIVLVVAFYKINAETTVTTKLRVNGSDKIALDLQEYKDGKKNRSEINIVFRCKDNTNFPNNVMQNWKKNVQFHGIKCINDTYKDLVFKYDNENSKPAHWVPTSKIDTTINFKSGEHTIKCEKEDEQIKLIGENMDNGKDINLCEPANILL